MAAHYPTHTTETREKHDTNRRHDVLCLPIAPQPVARTRFSPPPSSLGKHLVLPEAIRLLQERMEKCEGISSVLLAGPGDPLATPAPTLEIVQEIRKRFSSLSIGLRSMGMDSVHLASQLAEAGVNYFEMQVEAVRQEVLEKLFAWIRPGAKTLKLSDASALLIQEQRSGVSALAFHEVSVSIVTTLYPGYNIDHVGKISEEMLELGAESISLTPYYPQPGAEVNLEPPTCEEVHRAKGRAALHLPVIESFMCSPSASQADAGQKNECTPKPTKDRPNIAVVSSNGIEVDLHLGQAISYLIYGPRGDGLHCLLETREAPEPGAGKKRWQQTATTLDDCFLLLTASAGDTPRRILAENNLQVHITEENIAGMVDALYGGGKRQRTKSH